MGEAIPAGPIERNERNVKPLSATDVLAPTTMKNAAKCDTSCELQNPVSHQNFERNLHFPREVCLLECLFSPHPLSVVVIDGRRRLFRCQRWRGTELRCKKASGSARQRDCLCSPTIDLCRVPSESRVKLLHTKYDVPEAILSPHACKQCEASPCSRLLGVSDDNGIGSPIRQDYPLNLSI